MDKNTGVRSHGISGSSNTAIMPAGACFLQFKLHQELLAEQQKAHKELVDLNSKFQKDNLAATKELVWGTWTLVAVTLLISFLNK